MKLVLCLLGLFVASSHGLFLHKFLGFGGFVVGAPAVSVNVNSSPVQVEKTVTSVNVAPVTKTVTTVTHDVSPVVHTSVNVAPAPVHYTKTYTYHTLGDVAYAPGIHYTKFLGIG